MNNPIEFLKQQFCLLQDSHNQVREAAEHELTRLSTEIGFTDAVFTIIKTSAQQGGKQAWDLALTACSYLHVNLKQFYSSRSGTTIPSKDKEYLAENIFDLVTCGQADQRVHQTALCILQLIVSADQSGLEPFHSAAWRNNFQQVVCGILESATCEFELLGRLSATLSIVEDISYQGSSLLNGIRQESRYFSRADSTVLVEIIGETARESQE